MEHFIVLFTTRFPRLKVVVDWWLLVSQLEMIKAIFVIAHKTRHGSVQEQPDVAAQG